jgi:hypothetical protein
MGEFFRVLGLTPPETVIQTGLMYWVLLSLAIPYAVLRIRDSNNIEQDPHVGLKCILYFAFSVGFLLLLSGLTTYVITVLDDLDNLQEAITRFDPPQRQACSVMLAGFSIAFLHMLLILGMTNTRSRPEVRRVFIGWRLVFHTLIVINCLMVLSKEVFEVSPDTEVMKSTGAFLVVWGPSWVLHLIMLRAARGTGRKPRDED